MIAAPVELTGRRLTLAVTVHIRSDGTWHDDFGYAAESPAVCVPGEPCNPRRDVETFCDAKRPRRRDESISVARKNKVASADAPERMSREGQAAAREIVLRVAGVEPRFPETIRADSAPEWGIDTPQFMGGHYDPIEDIVALALHGGGLKTAYHEAFHRLQRLFADNAAIRAVLDRELPRLREIVAAVHGMKRASRMRAKEIEAEAFAIWAGQMDLNGAAGVRVHIAIRKLWNRIRLALIRVRVYFRGARSTEDVFAMAHGGTLKSGGAGNVRLANAAAMSRLAQPQPAEIERGDSDAAQQDLWPAPGALTAAQTGHTPAAPNADAGRDRSASTRGERERRLRAKGVQPPAEDTAAQQGRIGETDIRGATSPLSIPPHVSRRDSYAKDYSVAEDSAGRRIFGLPAEATLLSVIAETLASNARSDGG